MSSSAPSELNATQVLTLIENGSYPREAVLMIARGFLPLGQDDLIAVLAHLASSQDEEISGSARTSLSETPARSLITFASNDAIEPAHLSAMLEATSDAVVLEPLIRNRSLPDDAVAKLAAHAEGRIQEVIVINQARILRAPAILDSLLANPHLTGDVRRRAIETREEFFEKQRPVAPAPAVVEPEPEEAPAPAEGEEAEGEADIPLDAISDLLEKAEAEGEAAVPPMLTDAEQKDEKKQALFAQILKMTTAQKVLLAFRGDKTARGILVRDRSKIVCTAAIRNPRMTDAEVEMIAGSRSVEEEVLRQVSLKREWMAKYPIVVALARNPKAPIGVVLPLINRLTLRDLKGLKDDKGVSETIRAMARKTFAARNQKS